jgi:predicted alpha/beta-hydrolase family hydrolase
VWYICYLFDQPKETLMPHNETVTLRVTAGPGLTVTAKVDSPPEENPARRVLVLAHGANNDLDFPLLAFLAAYLATNTATSTIRFNFPYVERGASSPDARAVLESTFLSVYRHAQNRFAPTGTSVFVGGKSLGGRTAAELVSRRSEAEGMNAAGLIELGYPLHRAGHKDRLFLEPLRGVDVPSLFCVGSRDPLCDVTLLRPVLAGLVPPGELYVVEGGDHSLQLPHSPGHEPHEPYEGLAKVLADFVTRISP